MAGGKRRFWDKNGTVFGLKMRGMKRTQKVEENYENMVRGKIWRSRANEIKLWAESINVVSWCVCLSHPPMTGQLFWVESCYQHSQDFIFFVTQKYAQYARVFHCIRLVKLNWDKHSSLFGPFKSFDEKNVLLSKQPLKTFLKWLVPSIRLEWMWVAVRNALAYYTSAYVIRVKRFYSTSPFLWVWMWRKLAFEKSGKANQKEKRFLP